MPENVSFRRAGGFRSGNVLSSGEFIPVLKTYVIVSLEFEYDLLGLVIGVEIIVEFNVFNIFTGESAADHGVLVIVVADYVVGDVDIVAFFKMDLTVCTVVDIHTVIVQDITGKLGVGHVT